MMLNVLSLIKGVPPLDFGNQTATYQELKTEGRRPLYDEKDLQHSQLLKPISHNFDILHLTESLAAGQKGSDPKTSQFTLEARRTRSNKLRKLKWSKGSDRRKIGLVTCRLKAILAAQVSERELLEVDKTKKSPNFWTNQKNSRKILAHLQKPTDAKMIITMLKTEPHPSYLLSRRDALNQLPRGFCLRQSQSEFDSESLTAEGVDDVIHVTKALTMRIPRSSDIVDLVTSLSIGKIFGAIGETTGLYDVLAMGTKDLIDETHSHLKLIGMVPKDRMSVWSYWWGFEVAIPSSSMERLKKARSIESAALQLLAALTIAGGAVELTPFVKYLSTYLDMEWNAIVSQNRGKGVVIAATWALPMALIPRAWDFDLSQAPEKQASEEQEEPGILKVVNPSTP